MKEEIKEADVKTNQKNRRTEAESSALDLLAKPLHKKRQEEGIICCLFS